MSSSDNPFPGPRPFENEEAARFFGRTALTGRVADAIAARRVVTVSGPSGSGKSSLMRAGVIPRLKSTLRFRAVVVDSWPGGKVRRGELLAFLAREVARGLDLPDAAEGDGEREDDALLATLKRAHARSSQPILLFLDQLEQLLVGGETPEDLAQLVAALDALERTRGFQLYLVMTLREDFLGRWKQLLHAHPALTRHGIRVPRMDVAEMTDAVVRTTEQCPPRKREKQGEQNSDPDRRGEPWTDDQVRPWVEKLTVPGAWTSDAPKVEAAYVQIVCRTLWEQGGIDKSDPSSKDRVLLSYLVGALRDLSWRQRLAVRALLNKAFITNAGTREPVAEARVKEALGGAPAKVDGVLRQLVDARILRSYEREGQVFYELGHDSLCEPIMAGRRLQNWGLRAVAVAAALGLLWLVVTGLVVVGDLIQDARLRAKAEDTILVLKAQDDGTASHEAVRLLLEVDPSNRDDHWSEASLQILQKPVPRYVVPVPEPAHGGVSPITFKTAWISDDGSRLLGVFAEIVPDEDSVWTVQEWTPCRSAWEPLRELTRPDGVALFVPVVSQDGLRIAAAGSDGVVRIWSLDRADLGAAPARVSPSSDSCASCGTWSWAYRRLAWNADHELAIAVCQDVAVVGADGADPVLASTVPPVPACLTVNSIAFSADGDQLITAADDGRFRVCEREQGDPSRWACGTAVPTGASRTSKTGGLYAASINGDGTQVLTASGDGLARVFTLQDPPPTEFQGSGVEPTGPTWDESAALTKQGDRGCGPFGEDVCAMRGAGFGPGERWYATWALDGQLHLWDTRTGTRIETLQWSIDQHQPVALQDRAGWIVEDSDDSHTLLVWDVTFNDVGWGHTERVNAIAFSPDGGRCASASNDGSVRLWTVTPAGLAFERSIAFDHAPHDLAFHPQGDWIAVATGSGEVWRVDSDDGEVASLGTCGISAAYAVAFAGDGTRLAVGGTSEADGKTLGMVCVAEVDGSIRWDIRGTTDDTVFGVALDRDGARLASGDNGGWTRLWDVEARGDLDGERSTVLGRSTSSCYVGAAGGKPCAVFDVEFGPGDTTLLAASRDGVARVWAVPEAGSVDGGGSKAMVALRGHELAVTTATFVHGGERVLTGSWDGTVRLWGLTEGRELVSLRTDNEQSWAVAASPADGWVAYGGDGGAVWLADVRWAPEVIVERLRESTMAGTDEPREVPDGKREAVDPCGPDLQSKTAARPSGQPGGGAEGRANSTTSTP